MKAKKRFCDTHPPVAAATLSGNCVAYLHGIEYGINDYAMIRVVRSYSLKADEVDYNRRKIEYTRSGRPYVKLPIGRVHLQEFIRLN